MKLLSAVALSVLSLQAMPAVAAGSPAASSPLLGRWALDIATLPMPPEQRPRQVTMEFRQGDGNAWHSHVDIVLHDGKALNSDASLTLDGKPVTLEGSYFADVATATLPAPNTLVMQLVDHGTPASTRIYSVGADPETMIETKAFFSHDGQPILQTNHFKRLP
ncbi:LuxR family transcriptional regulator [Stenotrophomonas sp. 24(2023)]|uniref:LuxR family transcriptional regulator n=1 Tax=Stenotrophomonas sp. 24(2023) TaxID=3068324 RepID=UPI0027DF52B4|nr:LuxR family transcriptional regulator [Stenotrophomonas sp. 24(2023)]WMJ68403.1 LuxR family transcriptional regulator [Stenotrophomonas sp. 24(2023)]